MYAQENKTKEKNRGTVRANVHEDGRNGVNFVINVPYKELEEQIEETKETERRCE